MATILHLVRLAEPGDRNALSEHGRVQAGLLGRRLCGLGIVAIHHGPAGRTSETARYLADAIPAAQVQETVLLRDLTPTPARGEEHTFPERLREWLGGVDPAERDPGGVQLPQAFEHSATVAEPVVLVTHAFVIGWFVRTAIEAPAHRWIEVFADHASLTTIAFRDDGRPPALIRFNDTRHLG